MSRSIHRRSLTARLLCAYVVLVVIVSFAGVGYAVPDGTPTTEASTESTSSPEPPPVDPPEEEAEHDGVEATEEPPAEEPPADGSLVAEVVEPASSAKTVTAAGPEPSAEPQAGATPDESPTVATGLGIVPVFVSGNPTCDNYSEFKIDISEFHDGVYTTSIEHSLPSGASITLANTSDFSFDFSASGIVIHGVFVKGGSAAYQYVYNPAVTGDTGLYTVLQNGGGYYGISHVTFCYSQAPSTGHVIVRKFDDLNGDGIRDGGEPWMAGFAFSLERGDSETGPWTPVNTLTTSGANGQASFGNQVAGWYRITEVLTQQQIDDGWTPTTPTPWVFYHTGEQNHEKWFGNEQLFEKQFELTYEGTPPADVTAFSVEFEADGVARAEDLSGSGPYTFTEDFPKGTVIGDVAWYALWEPEPGTSEKVLLGTTYGETLEEDTVNRFTFGSKIDGKKIEDLDGDGVKDADEPGLPGWTIELYRQVDGGWALYDSRVTGAGGYYKFYSVLPGTYRVFEDIDSQTAFDWSQSYPASPEYHECVIEPRLLAGGVSTACVGTQCLDKHFLNWAPATISGMKFEDLDADGVKDAGEPGLAGWIIYVDYDGDGVRDLDEPYDVTDANGEYEITGIRPGTYPVREVQVAGWWQTFGLQHVVGFESRGEYEDFDFGNWTSGTKSGTKFHDLDADGVWDAGEPGLAGWVVYVDYDGDGEFDEGVEPSAVTAADGSYTINGVVPGTYAVREVMQAGWFQSMPGAPDHSYVETFTSGVEMVDNDFGNWTHASIEGHKFADLAADGVFDADDPVLEGWTIYVDYNGNGELDQGEPYDVTDSNGRYSIDSVLPGTYWVREVDQAGWTPSRGGFQVTFESGGAYGADGAYDFGNWTTTGLSGYKFEDKDADGSWDQGEPVVEGVTVWLTGLDAFGQSVVATTSTDADGYYFFSGLAPGDYVVSEVVPEGWTQSYPASGHWDVTLYSGVYPEISLDFGNWHPADPHGHKFHDLNANGYWDEGEPTLEGWLITLEGTTGWGGSIAMTTTTDADGFWEFPVVPPGDYTVSETLVSGWTQSFPTGDGTYDIGLESGEIVADLDFGNWTTATKHGVKFYDADGDGAPREDGEIGLPGWTIFVDYNYNGSLDPGEPYGITGADGSYVITGIVPGTYPVREVMDDPDWRYTYPSNGFYLETFESDGAYRGNDFGNTTRVDKTFELTFETGVSVDATYVVTLTSEHVETSPPPIVPPLGDVDPQAIAIVIEDHELVLTETSPGVFSAVLPVWPQTVLTDIEWWAQYRGEMILLGTGSAEELIDEPTLNEFEYGAGVFGSKWNDTDYIGGGLADGVWDTATEAGMPGWTIELYRLDPSETWVLYDTTLTGVGGAYSFKDVLPGLYYLAEVIPTDPGTGLPTWTQSAGPDGVGEDAFEVGDGSSEGPVDFGNWEPGLPFTLDMGLVKDVDKSVVAPGDTLVYTITWTMVEGGIPEGEPFTITDDYDERYMSVVDAAGGTVSNGTIVWNLLGPAVTGDSGSITYTMKVNDTLPSDLTRIDNTAVIEVEGDGNPANNVDDARVDVEPFLPFTEEEEPFLPFTGGDALLILAVMVMAAAAGIALRAHGRRTT